MIMIGRGMSKSLLGARAEPRISIYHRNVFLMVCSALRLLQGIHFNDFDGSLVSILCGDIWLRYELLIWRVSCSLLIRSFYRYYLGLIWHQSACAWENTSILSWDSFFVIVSILGCKSTLSIWCYTIIFLNQSTCFDINGLNMCSFMHYKSRALSWKLSSHYFFD